MTPMPYRLLTALCVTALASLSGCASAPTAQQLAGLPTVTYPDKPTTPDFIYKLPAGQAIDMRLLADGSLLDKGIDQTVSARLKRDLYLHKEWASEDGQTWLRADQLVGVNLNVTLPSWQKPGPGELHMSIERKAQQ